MAVAALSQNGAIARVMMAVATDAHAVPLHLEVLRGNCTDNTIVGFLATLRRRFGIAGKRE